MPPKGPETARVPTVRYGAEALTTRPEVLCRPRSAGLGRAQVGTLAARDPILSGAGPFVGSNVGRGLLRIYACGAGLVLLAVGLAGFTVSPKMNAAESFFHLAVGVLFVYLSLWQRDRDVVRTVIGGMGVLLLLSKGAVVAIVVLVGSGEPLFGSVEVVCFTVGFLSVIVARLGRDASTGAD